MKGRLHHRYMFIHSQVLINERYNNSDTSDCSMCLSKFNFNTMNLLLIFYSHFEGGSSKPKSMARKLWTSPRFRRCSNGVHSGCNHDVAACCRYQHRSRDSVSRIDTVSFFTLLASVPFTIAEEKIRRCDILMTKMKVETRC